MKVIFLSFSVTNSSVTDYLLSIALKLAENNKVIIVTDRMERTPMENLGDVEILKWPSKRPTAFKDFLFLYKLTREYRPYLMLALFGAVNMFTIVGWLLGVKNRIAFVQTLSTQFVTKRLLVLRKILIYRFCTKLFANSTATKIDLIKTFHIPEKKIEVFFNAVKIPSVFESKLPFDVNKIVYVGRIHPSKGITTLIRAMQIVVIKYPALELSVIGGDVNSEYGIQCVNLVTSNGLRSNIKFYNSIAKDEVLREFQQSYFSVVPSITEAFGFVVIESFSVRTPVIGSNTTGISEIIRDTIDGLLFEPEMYEDLANKMIHLLEDMQLREKFSENCYNRFASTFEVNVLSSKIADYIESLA